MQASDETVDVKVVMRGRLSSSFHPNASRCHAIRWKSVNCFEKKRDKKILDNVWGEALPFQTTALMGPSGAGKTTLLHVLADRAPSNKNITVQADLLYDYAKINELPGGMETFRRRIAFVPQEDVLHTTSTPREAIRFSARLRLPLGTSNEQIEALVDEYLENLGLSKCADTVIGGGLKKGISGGQKKRTAIGVELVTNPGIIFCDEPTSGLDAVSAEQIMELLQTIARAGNVVILTIHQPSLYVFSTFLDRLILLNEGKIMHEGSTADIPQYFENLGYAVPQNVNPADWILKVAMSNTFTELQESGFFPKDTRHMPMIRPERISYYNPKIHKQPVSMLTQLTCVFSRSVIQLKRNPSEFFLFLFSEIVVGLLIGCTFYMGGHLSFDNSDNLYAIFTSVNNSYAIVLFSVSAYRLSVYAAERPLFMKEYFTGTYRPEPYLGSHFVLELAAVLVAEVPKCLIVYFMFGVSFGFGYFYLITVLMAENAAAVAALFGSIFTQEGAAMGSMNIAIIPQILFGGLFVPVSYLPIWCRWFSYLMFSRYASSLSSFYLFVDCARGDPSEQNPCVQFLMMYQISENNMYLYWLGFVGLFIATKVTATVIFAKKARHYE